MSNRMHQMSFSQTYRHRQRADCRYHPGIRQLPGAAAWANLLLLPLQRYQKCILDSNELLAACVLRLRFWRNFLFSDIFKQYEIDVTVFIPVTSLIVTWWEVYIFTYIIETYLLWRHDNSDIVNYFVNSKWFVGIKEIGQDHCLDDLQDFVPFFTTLFIFWFSRFVLLLY